MRHISSANDVVIHLIKGLWRLCGARNPLMCLLTHLNDLAYKTNDGIVRIHAVAHYIHLAVLREGTAYWAWLSFWSIPQILLDRSDRKRSGLCNKCTSY